MSGRGDHAVIRASGYLRCMEEHTPPDDSSTAAEPEPLLPLRMLAQWVFCPRLFYLMHVQGQMLANEHVWRGRKRHEDVDTHTARRARRPGVEEDEGHLEAPASWERRTAVMLSSARLGLIGKLDGVLLDDAGQRAVPTELKSGAGPRDDHDPSDVEQGVWRADAVHVAAQALLLEDAGYDVPGLEIYYAKKKRLVRFQLTQPLRARAKQAIERANEDASREHAPAPLEDSPKCPGCSLLTVCLPNETLALRRAAARDDSTRALRRIVPPRLDEQSVFVTTPGAKVRKERAGLLVEIPARIAAAQDIPRRHRFALDGLRELCLVGRVQLTSSALAACSRHGVDVTWLSSGSARLVACAHSPLGNNVQLRIAQHRLADARGANRLNIVRALLDGKLRNQRTLLRRNADEDAAPTLKELRALRRSLARADSIDTMRGLEGRAARIYFECFSRLVEARGGEPFAMQGRSRRPPADPTNAMLSFGYAVLTKDAASIARRVGFDPMRGFLHEPGYGRPSLALDLIEEFRPLIVDSTVMRVIATGQVSPKDFREDLGGVLLGHHGRTRFLAALRARKDELVTHPLFGYRLSYLRTMEVQARLLARVVEGEIDAYTPMTTR